MHFLVLTFLHRPALKLCTRLQAVQSLQGPQPNVCCLTPPEPRPPARPPPWGRPVAPGTPAECLLPHTSRAQASSQTAALGPLTAVVLGVVVGAELEAVVAPADQVALAAPVSVVLAAVPGPVTVP